jgi:hypothetical protein
METVTGAGHMTHFEYLPGEQTQHQRARSRAKEYTLGPV